MHNHTNRYSSCSQISPQQLIETYLDSPFQALCITEHNLAWSGEEQTRLIKKYRDRMTIFFGMEVDTDLGHVLLYGHDLSRYKGFIKFKQLIKKLDPEKTALVWAHPLRRLNPLQKRVYLRASVLKNFDAIELYNGNLTREVIETTRHTFKKFGLPFTGGSDTHSRGMALKCGTLFEQDFSTTDDLVRQLKRGDYRPVCVSQ